MPQSLRDLALDLGLEDDIPLFQVAQSSLKARPDTSLEEVISELSDVLVRLFQEGRIAVYEGPWQSNDPPQKYGSEVVELLADLRRYRFENEEAFGLDRVYYINVDNIAE